MHFFLTFGWAWLLLDKENKKAKTAMQRDIEAFAPSGRHFSFLLFSDKYI